MLRQTATPSITIQRTQLTDDGALDMLKLSLAIDFANHDALLLQKIAAARDQIERLTGVLLWPATVTVNWLEVYDWVALPWCPVSGTITATDIYGNTLTVQEAIYTSIPRINQFSQRLVMSSAQINISGLQTSFPRVVGDFPAGLILSYMAGYDNDNRPGDLLEAVLQLAANLFDGGTRDWRSLCLAHRRKTWAS